MKIAVIGGGASGMMAAISAAKEGAKVFLYERNDRVGKKILATGNGKCNFSNLNLGVEQYYSEDMPFVKKVLDSFSTSNSVDFFEEAGMMIKDKNGYLYPASEQASTVLDILRMQLIQNNVCVYTDKKVSAISKVQGGAEKFRVVCNDGKELYDKVILSCGGKASPITGSDGNGYKLAEGLGHKILPVFPALVQLKCQEEYIKAVSGVRLDAKLTLKVNEKEVASERGELQLADYGISGIVTFQLSRIAVKNVMDKKNTKVFIDCLPGYTDEEYAKFCKQRKALYQNSDCTVEEFFTGMLNKKIMLLFMKLAGLKTTEKYILADKKKIDKVFELCRVFPLTITGFHSFDKAQVTAGGVPLWEVNETLESKKVKGLYIVGEMLDADGKCGGYNLQWAWSTGYIAGKHAAMNKQ